MRERGLRSSLLEQKYDRKWGNGDCGQVYWDRNMTANEGTGIAVNSIWDRTLAWDLSGEYDPTDCLDLDPVTLYSEQ